MNLSIILTSVLFLLAPSTCTDVDAIPECARECLKPLVKTQKTNVDLFLNLDDICDKLEPAAVCAQKCGQKDHTIFHQVTTNFRLHCIDFIEELEDHMDCLKRNAVAADTSCQKECKIDISLESNVSGCKRTECISFCMVRKLAHACPLAEAVLKKISVRRAKELEIARTHEDFKLMPRECQQLHDSVHVQKAMDEL